MVGLLIGPLFVTAELGFLLQMRLELKAEIHRRHLVPQQVRK